jgi:molybdopterin converting factor small subunit
MPIMKFPTPLRDYIGGKAEVHVSGSTVEQAMQDLMTQFPSLRQHLTNQTGHLRSFVNLFLGEDNIKDLKGLDTELAPEDILRLVPSVAGG